MALSMQLLNPSQVVLQGTYKQYSRVGKLPEAMTSPSDRQGLENPKVRFNRSIRLLNVSGSSPKGYYRLSGGKGGMERKFEESQIFLILGGFRGPEGFQGVPGACGSHSAQISTQTEPYRPVSNNC